MTNAKTFSVRDLFNLDVPEKVVVRGFSDANPFTPARDDDYQFRREVMSDVLAWLNFSTDPLYIRGPSGSGKSSVICQMAARLNLGVHRVTAHSRLETPELIGHHAIIDGDMVFIEGPLVNAMRRGEIFMLDEIDLLDPATAAGLNGVLEGAALTIPEKGGEIVRPAPGFRFVATGNTGGCGDSTGVFQGTMRQNLAFMDRFWMMEVGYPSADEEKKILSKAAPKTPEVVREGLIEVSNLIRKAFMGDGSSDIPPLDITVSTRSLVRWAQMCALFQGIRAQGRNPVLHALDRAIAFKATPESRHALHEIVQRQMGDATPAAS